MNPSPVASSPPFTRRSGEYVKANEPILTLDTDKVSTEIAAETGGVLTLISNEGDEVKIGQVVATLDPSAPAPAAGAPAAAARTHPHPHQRPPSPRKPRRWANSLPRSSVGRRRKRRSERRGRHRQRRPPDQGRRPRAYRKSRFRSCQCAGSLAVDQSAIRNPPSEIDRRAHRPAKSFRRCARKSPPISSTRSTPRPSSRLSTSAT